MKAVTATSAKLNTTDKAVACDLPKPYRIMDHAIPFVIPGFEQHFSPYDFTFTPEPITSEEWFTEFTDRVCAALGKTYLPVCRASDGEFLFLFGYQPPSLRWRPIKRLALWTETAAARLLARHKGFEAVTAQGVSSGCMPWHEWRRRRESLSDDYRRILRDGILAMHLNFSIVPYQEHYFPPLSQWLQASGVPITTSNYVPFYFVYAILRGPRRQEILADRDLVVVHSATGYKRACIERALFAEGVRRLQWITISPSRSVADVVDLSLVTGQPQLCLVGAGVGKAAILRQLQPLNIPCIDAGFVLEVWADPEKRWDRPIMLPDLDYDLDRIRFLRPDMKAFMQASHRGDCVAMARLAHDVRRMRFIRDA